MHSNILKLVVLLEDVFAKYGFNPFFNLMYAFIYQTVRVQFNNEAKR